MAEAVWALSWHFGACGIGIAAALAFAWFSPVFKKTALWVALSIAIAMSFYTTGVVNENAFWQAKWNSAQKKAVVRGTKARARATTSVDRGVRDGRDIDQ